MDGEMDVEDETLVEDSFVKPRRQDHRSHRQKPPVNYKEGHLADKTRDRSSSRGSSKSAKKFITPKMITQSMTSTSNYFAPLANNADLTIPASTAPIKAKTKIVSHEEESKAKPVIVLNTTHETLVNLAKTIGIKISTRKMIAAKSYMVFTAKPEDKTTLTEALKSRVIEYHTYSEPQERQTEFLLKNFEKMTNEEVKKKLTEAGVDVTKVITINKSESFPLYKVCFGKGTTTLDKLTKEHRIVDYMRVSWEKMNFEAKRPTQCKRCQAWGHSANNCGRKYRCMKCNVEHGHGECKRTKDDPSPPYCVNCKQEGHLSSSWNCENFKRHQHKIQARRQQQRPREFRTNTTGSPWMQQSPSGRTDPYDHLGPSGRAHFPNLPPQGNRIPNTNVNAPPHNRPVHSEQQSRPNNMPNLNDLTDEFNAIPGIQEAIAILKDFYRQLRECPNPFTQAQLIYSFTQSSSHP
jgi:hypothetical protein